MMATQMGAGLSRCDWYLFWRVWRKHHTTSRGCSYADKVIRVEAIRKYEQHGQVRVCARFMDCDCASSTVSRRVPANYYAVIREMDDHYDNAEGTGGCWITYPDDLPPPEHRDYALEAFEDGHPHSIHY